MDIFPVINCREKSCFEDRLEIAENLPFLGEKIVHIDVSDGIFASSKMWVTSEIFKTEFKANADIKFAVHLMLVNPLDEIKNWIEAGAKEIIVHVESDIDLKQAVDICLENDVKITLAANPDTPISSLIAEENLFSRFLLLAVNPGPAGQAMSSEVIPRIEELRAALPSATIEVDGGVTPKTVMLIEKAGADIAVSGTYIFVDVDPESAYSRLLNSARRD